MKEVLQDAATLLLVFTLVLIIGWFAYTLGYRDGIDEGKRISTWHNGIKGI